MRTLGLIGGMSWGSTADYYDTINRLGQRRGSRRQWPDIRAALADRRSVMVLAGSATLIAVNWLVYVWAIQQGHVYAASLGY
ncbi:hypothetical protein J4558_05240 [Leptolyngbya sp. 15MV]|nr:hypothetical protein J4558_05240 [Leptolyngbya sp. 15MV]